MLWLAGILGHSHIALTLLIVAILSLFIIDLFGRKILLVVSGAHVDGLELPLL